jgi:hypothetical protein
MLVFCFIKNAWKQSRQGAKCKLTRKNDFVLFKHTGHCPSSKDMKNVISGF